MKSLIIATGAVLALGGLLVLSLGIGRSESRASLVDSSASKSVDSEPSEPGSGSTSGLQRSSRREFAALLPDRGADGNRDSEEAELSQRRMGLLGGLLTRDEVGNSYDQEIRAIAKSLCVRPDQEPGEAQLALDCGFKDWAAVERALADSNYPAMKSALSALVDLATEARSANLLAADRVWDRIDRIEVWDPNAEHDVADWRRSNGVDTRLSASHFTAGVMVGDRAFRMHFLSSDFPEVEELHTRLRAARSRFWAVGWGAEVGQHRAR